MGEIGLQLLEQLSIPINYEDFNVKDSSVMVNITVEDPDAWKPSKPHDKKWNVTNQEMTEVSIHLLFVICNLNKSTKTYQQCVHN